MKLNNKIEFISELLENLDEKKSLKELNRTQKNLRRLSLLMLCKGRNERLETLEEEYDVEKTKKMIYHFLKVFLNYE